MGQEFDNQRIVIFDWGGVIDSVQPGYFTENDAMNRVLEHFGIYIGPRQLGESNKQEIANLLNRTKTVSGIDIATTHDLRALRAYVSALAKLTEKTIPYDEFAEVWSREHCRSDYHKDVVSYMHELTARCYVGLFSNCCFWDYRNIQREVGLEKIHYAWLSYEMGGKKPYSYSYDYVEDTLPYTVKHILFIDDKKRNLVPARDRGWGVCHSNGSQFENISNNVEKFLLSGNLPTHKGGRQ